MGGTDWYFPGVQVTFTGTDNTGGSGVLVTRYRLAKDTEFSEYGEPLLLTEPGEYTFYYYSVDKNLNQETQRILNFRIDDGPPKVLSVAPAEDASRVSISSPITVVFGEPMDENLITSDRIHVSGSLGGQYSGSISYDPVFHSMTFYPGREFELLDTITVVLSGDVTDLAGITLDGNGNGIAEGSPVDDFVWFFTVDKSAGYRVQIAEILVVVCPEIEAIVSVTDEAGEPALGLSEIHFSVYEDGVEQMPIEVAFKEQSASPISVALAMDYSGSMSSQAIAAMEDAAIQFIGNMGEEDRGEIIKFANGVQVMQSFTADKAALVAAVRASTSLSTSATAVYDAVYQGVADVSAEPGRKAVIAMTDGADNRSVRPYTEIIDYAKAKGVPVFTIGLGSSISREILQEIADHTGGLYYEAPDSEDLQAVYRSISEVLSNHYIVKYTSTSLDGEDHELKILVENGLLRGLDLAGFTACVPVIPGDLNDDGQVGLDDAILGLQFLANVNPGMVLNDRGDVNDDGRIGLEEVLYILQFISGMREAHVWP